MPEYALSPNNWPFAWGSKPHLTHASLCHSQSITKQHLDRFSSFAQITAQCRYTLQRVTPFPLNLLLSVANLDPIQHVPRAYPSSQPKRHFDRFSRFPQKTVECPCTLHRDALPPQNCLFPIGDLDLRLIHGSLGSTESSTQTASPPVKPSCMAH